MCCLLELVLPWVVTFRAVYRIRFHDYFTGECLSRVTGHSGGTTCIAFSSDCRVLVSVGRDGCLIMWRLAPSITKVMLERLAEMTEARAETVSHLSPPVNSDGLTADLSLDEQSVLSGIGPPLPSIQSPKRQQPDVTLTQSYMESVDGDAVAESFMHLPLPLPLHDVKGSVIIESDVTPRTTKSLLPPPIPIRTGGFILRPNSIAEAAQVVLDSTPLAAEDNAVFVDDRSELSSLSHSSDDDEVIQPVSTDGEWEFGVSSQVICNQHVL
jgi:hypothetical protein